MHHTEAGMPGGAVQTLANSVAPNFTCLLQICVQNVYNSSIDQQGIGLFFTFSDTPKLQYRNNKKNTNSKRALENKTALKTPMVYFSALFDFTPSRARKIFGFTWVNCFEMSRGRRSSYVSKEWTPTAYELRLLVRVRARLFGRSRGSKPVSSGQHMVNNNITEVTQGQALECPWCIRSNRREMAGIRLTTAGHRRWCNKLREAGRVGSQYNPFSEGWLRLSADYSDNEWQLSLGR